VEGSDDGDLNCAYDSGQSGTRDFSNNATSEIFSIGVMDTCTDAAILAVAWFRLYCSLLVVEVYSLL